MAAPAVAAVAAAVSAVSSAVANLMPGPANATAAGNDVHKLNCVPVYTKFYRDKISANKLQQRLM